MRLFLPSLLFVLACQPDGYVNPTDDVTGTPPRDASVIYAIDSSTAPTYLNANLQQTNATQATFTVSEAGIVPMPVNGSLPSSAGADANLLAGVGFGTYPNPDLRAEVTSWAEASAFKSVLTAEVSLVNAFDSVTFCRSFATTCVTVIKNPLGVGVDVAFATLAANLPDTEIGPIDEGVSASIRGTGDSGLTIALTDEDTVAVPLALPSEPFELQWTTARGATENSLDWSIAIDGTVVGAGNTAVDLAASITTTEGVGLIFDDLFTDGDYAEHLDYSYDFLGDEGEFDDLFGAGVSLSERPGLDYTPVKVYPTDEPTSYELLTLSGELGQPHAVAFEDGIVGAQLVASGVLPQATVYSTAFDGDDFAGIAGLEGAIDQGGSGGGFYPSPSFCYSQILPGVIDRVEAGVQREIHRQMYAAIAYGVAGADAALPGISGYLQGEGHSTATYTALTSPDDYITIGEDYADNNVATAISTSAEATYTATLNESVSTTFTTELGTIVGILMANPDDADALFDDGLDDPDFLALAGLAAGLTTPHGVQDGRYDLAEDEPEFDSWPPFSPGDCQGYDCNVDWVLRDVVNGTNDTGANPPPAGADSPVPALAGACLWGVPASDTVPSQAATLPFDDGTPLPDQAHPSYDEIPASAAVPPVREQAAPGMNNLVMGLFGGFVGQAYGPTVPASNFSMTMGVGAPATGEGPAVSSIDIRTGAAASE